MMEVVLSISALNCPLLGIPLIYELSLDSLRRFQVLVTPCQLAMASLSDEMLGLFAGL